MAENIFKTVYRVERNGKTFFLHWQYRFDPVTAVVVGAVAAGTTMAVAGSLQAGKEAERLAKQSAAIDIQKAEAARRRSVEEAKLQKERGRRILATQKMAAAAGGVRLDVGAPLVIEAQTRADIAKDIGFTLERGREEAAFYRSRAAVEKAQGRAAKKQSRWDAISQGLTGFGTIAYMGYDAGWFSGGGGLTTSGSAVQGMPAGRYGMGW